MERRLMEKRGGGGLGRKEEKTIWNGGVEESGSFKKTVRYCISPITIIFFSLFPAPLPDSFI